MSGIIWEHDIDFEFEGEPGPDFMMRVIITSRPVAPLPGFDWGRVDG